MFNASKRPDEVLDYDFDLNEWFADNVLDEINSVQTGMLPGSDGDGLDNLNVDRVEYLDSPSGPEGLKRVAKVWLSRGVSGHVYHILIAVTTEGGRVKEFDFKVKVSGAVMPIME